MKTKIITIIFCLNLINVLAQEKIIFLHQNTMYESHNEFVGDKLNGYKSDIDINTNLFTMGMFSVNYSTIQNRFFQEFTLMPLFIARRHYKKTYNDGDYAQELDGYNYTNIKAHLSYKFSFLLRNNKNRFLPYLGVGSRIYWSLEDYFPVIPRTFPHTINYLGHILLTNIGFIYKITGYAYLNIQIPVSIIDTYMLFDNVSNPTLPEKLRTTTTIENIYFPEKYSLKIGLGVIINKK